MIKKECFTAEWIEQVSSELHYNDKNLIEKVIRALSLLEMLVKAGCPLVFKGGTALMLILGKSAHRLSIDIDLICPPGTNIEDYLKSFADFGFINLELVERKQRDDADIPKSHSKFFYQIAYAFHHSLESGTILAFRSHIRVRNETEGGLVALEQVQLVLVPAGTQRGHRVLQTDGLQAQRIRSAFHDDEILCIPQSKGAVDAKQGFSLGVEHAGGGIDVLGGIRIGTDVTGRIGNDASPPVPYRNHDPFAEHGVTGAVLLPFEHAQFKQQFLFQSFLLTEIAEGVAVFRGIS